METAAPETEWTAPESVAEACAALSDAGGRARAIAGGTGVPLAELSADRQVRLLVDLVGIAELRRIEPTASAIRIGATTTIAELAGDRSIAQRAPLLAAASRGIADEVLRGMATIGGNVALRGARPHELPVVLAVLGATIEIAGASGRSALAAADLADREFALAPDELITAFVLEGPRTDGRWAYRKSTTNLASYGIATTAIAEGDDGWSAYAALGESIPQRLEAVEEALAAVPGSFDPAAVAEHATRDLVGVDDALATGSYRRRSVEAAILDSLDRLAGRDR